jgi:anti-sigma factor RsiW
MALRRLRMFRRPPVVCRDAVELVTAYLEGQLARRDRARFEAHLAECPHCTAYVEQMRTTIVVLGRARPEPVDAETRDELVALYHRWQAG